MNSFRKDFLSEKIQETYGTNAKFVEALRKNGIEKTEDAIKKWRQGNSVPKVGELKAISRTLGIEIQELFEEPIFDGITKAIKQLGEPARNINKYFSDISKKITSFTEGLNFHNKEVANNDNGRFDINIICIPKLSITASAGNGNNLESIDKFEMEGILISDADTLRLDNNKNLKAIKVDGYSMIPVLLPDSWVIFNDDGNFRGDGIYVLNWDNTLMVKIIQLAPNGKIEIISANKEYKSYIVDLEDSQIAFKIVGRVIKSII
ncbi:MAG: S24 family peptidase [Campylobacteraceae bacterium]|jgi:phage repressor protein C with HTH and peptisase S24 domain|nr:S24 family peptidase [Campylobacteraceae bacterium]